MSTRITSQLGKKSSFFNYLVNQRPDHAEITIQFHTDFYTTQPLPATIEVLETIIPRIFKHKCFNNHNRTFKKEAEQTELGHLFEHILLEFLCRYKFHEGEKNITLKGLTEWNWQQDPKGIFHISLNTTTKDQQLLQSAIENTSHVMETILLTPHHYFSHTQKRINSRHII